MFNSARVQFMAIVGWKTKKWRFPGPGRNSSNYVQPTKYLELEILHSMILFLVFNSAGLNLDELERQWGGAPGHAQCRQLMVLDKQAVNVPSSNR